MKIVGMDSCGSDNKKLKLQTQGVAIMPSMEALPKCAPSSEQLQTYSKAGYQLCSFVEDFLNTNAGPIPRVKTSMDKTDHLSTIKVRLGISRNDYSISPGLYCVGKPDKTSEVLVTANFKLTFDHLRRELGDIDAWILVLDTNGVNVWCAAGKKTFSTHELVNRIKLASLEKVVDHRRLIVPQLGATGISARNAKKLSGFEVVYGPVRAKDIPQFLKNNHKADIDMRRVTFSFLERVILTPVELKLLIKPALIASLALFVLSGFGPGFFSLSAAVSRGFAAVMFLLAGILSGVIITPAFLPALPFKEFAAKGIISGIIFSLLSISFFAPEMAGTAALIGLSLITVTISSALAMHFTGATPFTSPSGVEKEMRRFLPVQLAGLISAIGLWIYSAF